MKPTITLSPEDAHLVLNTLRTVQMNLGAAMQAVPSEQHQQLTLFSNDFAGTLMQAVDTVEGALHASGVIDMNANTSPWNDAAEIAIRQMKTWANRLADSDEIEVREQFHSDVDALALTIRMAAQQHNSPGPSPN